MNYYPFHIGDYIAHTAHLDPLEDCAYRRLLDAYYLNEGPLPSDIAICARQIRMKANLAEVEQVLKEFFELTEQGWKHSRCEAEIAHMNDRSAKARASAEASVNARRAKANKGAQATRGENPNERKTNAERTLNERSANAELPNTQYPKPNTQNPNTPQPPLGDSPGETKASDLALESPLPTLQGATCMAMKAVGVPDVNPSHSKLLALLEAGVPLEGFVSAARDCVMRGKGSFRYVLSVVESQEREARELAQALKAPKDFRTAARAGVPTNRQEALEARNRAVGDSWAAKMLAAQQQGGCDAH